jgi:ornithine lipid ester-linked acyl 2-hydroxylase
MNLNSTPQHKNIWYCDSGKKYEGKEPLFFDIDAPWVDLLEAEWLVIRSELNNLLQSQTNPLIHNPEIDLVSKPGQWKVFTFFFWNRKFEENCQKCPQTVELLKSLPNIVTASFSLLESNSTIKPHRGNTNAIMRCHLGLIIPASLPDCGIKIGNKEKSWVEGESFVFCDCHTHSAWNHTSEKRYVLMVDIVRPEFVSKTKEICDRVFSFQFNKAIRMLINR